MPQEYRAFQEKVVQNAVAGTANGDSFIVATSSGAYNQLAFQITGIVTATVTFEATINGNDWVPFFMVNLASNSGATTATANGIYRQSVLGLLAVRARISAHTNGTITINGLATA